MDYLKIYNSIISFRQNNPISKDDCYCEKHHILPKSEGGNDENSNLVYLTAREHYIAHLLLTKIYNDYKMICAVVMFNNGRRDHKFNSKLYQKAKEEYSIRRTEHLNEYWKQYPEKKIEMKEALLKYNQEHPEQGQQHSEWLKQYLDNDSIRKHMSEVMSGDKNPMYGKNHTDESKKKMSEFRTGMKLKETTKEKLRVALKGKMVGEKHPFYGKHHTDEARKNQSLHASKPTLGKQWSDEDKKKLGERRKLRYKLNIPSGVTLQKYLRQHPEIKI